MSEQTAITIVEAEVRLGSLSVQHPTDMIGRASEIATALARVVKDRKLSRNISGREYVYVDGWSTMGAMIGILPREVSVLEHDNGDFEATVELIRVTDGAVVGQGSAIVGYEEATWKSRPRYAKRSMAITRATGKAYRLGFSWIMSLAGYATTPAEEMDGLEDKPAQAPSTAPKAPAQSVSIPTVNPVNKAHIEAFTGEAVKEPVVTMTLEDASMIVSSEGHLYGDIPTEKLAMMANSITKKLRGAPIPADERASLERKYAAIDIILKSRSQQ